MRKITVMLSGLLLFIVPGGCESPFVTPGATTRAALSDEAGREMVRTELVFGLSRNDGSAVDEMQWKQFVDQSIVAWFPAGFTEIDSDGHWRAGDGKVISERSKVVIIFHDGSEQTLKKLEDLRQLYCQRFGQQAVIRASSAAWVSF